MSYKSNSLYESIQMAEDSNSSLAGLASLLST